ncbi:MAG TPA: 4-(cytidine 5'-diphospho)-2-C-methyl-D-erythritol kinase [Syntrophales bacterium]|nr:4-(cytidine 5'-diphospho)-2-C-methyl-D-erythritol kinase [Syntrophales bacterium]
MRTVQSPAKINLILKVLRRREDGYHDIASLMQKVSLSDEIQFTPRRQGIALTCPGSDLPTGEGNLVVRAARALFTEAGFAGGVEIALRKRIPTAAGLGGGSSNAATTLVILNDLFRFGFDRERLIRIGARLGADVPFFIYGSAAWAFGIGDLLEPAVIPAGMWFVLVNPGFEVPTKWVYQSLNLPLTNTAVKYSIPSFSGVRDLAAALSNDLETVTVRQYPVLAELKGFLLRQGAIGSLMSGSGPTVFGLFDNEPDAIKAEGALRTSYAYAVFRAQTI